MLGLGVPDGLALLFALFAALGYEWLVSMSPWRYQTLNHQMERQRFRWMDAAATRPLRVLDTQIFNGLQAGANFFASTALAAMGASISLFTVNDRLLNSLAALPFTEPMSRSLWSIKILCLLGLFAFAFISFAWSYRLFHYAAVVFGALRDVTRADLAELQREAKLAAHISVAASRAFNHGMRALFFAVAFVFWFAGPLALALAIVGLSIMLVQRQFFSSTRATLIAAQADPEAQIDKRL